MDSRGSQPLPEVFKKVLLVVGLERQGSNKEAILKVLKDAKVK